MDACLKPDHSLLGTRTAASLSTSSQDDTNHQFENGSEAGLNTNNVANRLLSDADHELGDASNYMSLLHVLTSIRMYARFQ